MTRVNATAAKVRFGQLLNDKLASRLRAAGATYATVFGSVARGEARALGGCEILCDSVASRQRMITRVQRSEDDRLSAALAVRAARAGLFA